MRRNLAKVMAGAMFFCAGAVQAQQRTLWFEGSLDDDFGFVAGSPAFEQSFAVGNPFSGFFTFESSTPGTSFPGVPGGLIYLGAVTSFSMTLNGFTFAQSAGGRVETGETPGGDYLSALGGQIGGGPPLSGAVADFTPFQWIFVVRDATGTSLTGLALPSAIPNIGGGGWEGGTVELLFSNATGDEAVIVAPLSSVSMTAPIPEPETYVMLLAGLGLLGFEARRRRKLQRAPE